MIVIGITGGIGSGKSTVSKYIESKGYIVLDADEIARKLIDRGKKVYNVLLDRYGENILDENGNIVRDKVGEIVFNNKEELKFLNELTHSLVEKEMLECLKIHSSKKIVFLDVPLLFEAGVDKHCDYIWTVFVDEAKKIERTMCRDNVSVEKVKSIIENQMDDKLKASMSDEVIENNSDIETLFRGVDKVLLKYEEF